MGRTGLILRQWVARDGCYVIAKQAYAYDTGDMITSQTEVLCVFKFNNEWRAALCQARMNNHDWNVKERAWRKYFNTSHKISWWRYQEELISKDAKATLPLTLILFIGLMLYFLA